MPIYPAYAIMFRDRSDLSTAAITQLFAVLIVVSIISEIPAGMLADRYSRKLVLALGPLLQALTFVVWMVFPTFTGYAIGMVLWGIGMAMLSGALQAYLFDELKQHRSEGEFERIYGRAIGLRWCGMVASYFVTAAVGLTLYSPLLIMSIVISLAACVIALQFPKETRNSHPEFEPDASMLRSGLRHVWQTPLALRFVIAIALAGGVWGTWQNVIPLYFNTVGASDTAIPLLLAGGLAISGLLSWWAHRVAGIRPHLLSLLVIAGGFVLIAGSYGSTGMAVVTGLVFSRTLLFSHLLYSMGLQHVIKSEHRATISSVPSFLSSALALLIMLGYGVISSLSSDIVATRTLGVLLILGAACVAVWIGSVQVRTRT